MSERIFTSLPCYLPKYATMTLTPLVAILKLKVIIGILGS